MSEPKRYRVRQCGNCKARNIITVTASNNLSVCPKCGEHPTISSYSACPHNPVHAWSERGLCIKAQASTRKRQKQVFSTGEIPHLWAHKIQESARNPQKNLYFEGDTIYSYGSHFPIAVHITNKKGKHAVLFTNRGYSSTTAGHKSAVRSAIPSNVPVFEVEIVRQGWLGSGEFADTKSELHQKNIHAYTTNLAEEIRKATAARTLRSKQWKTEVARKTRSACLAYCQFFGLKTPKLPEVPRLTAALVRKMKTREAFLSSPEHLGVLLIERARREMNEFFAKRRAAEDAIAEWRKGNTYVRLPYGMPTMLRIRGNEVETSMGVRVPVSHAKRVLKIVQQVVLSGQEFVSNGHSIPVGVYKIDRIESNGTLHAGCHHISLAEIEAIAPALEVAAETSASEVA